MRLTKDITEDLLREVAGEDTIKLVGLLKGKDNVSEFKLAEKLRLTVNTVRNMLYRLQAHNLVTSIRKKDQQKGWYIYYWTFNDSQARTLSKEIKQNKLDKLREILHIESQETFYVCPEKCTRFKQENAMEYEFKCPECGTLLTHEDNTEFIKTLRAKIIEIEEELVKSLVEVRKKRTKLTKESKKVKRAKPKAKKLGRVKSKVTGKRKSKLKIKKPKLARKTERPKPKTKKPKRAKTKISKIKRPKLRTRVVKRVKPKVTKKVKKSKVKTKKLKLTKKVKVRKPKTKKKIAKKKSTKKRATKMKSKPKKKSVLKKVKRFLRRK